MRRETRWWLALIAVLVALLATYVAAGPYLTIRAIRQAVVAQDAGELSEQVDFPALRTSLKAQLIDAMVREAGPELQSSALGAFALTMATDVVNGAVEAMVNPSGLAAVMQGRRGWRETEDSFRRPAVDPQGNPVATQHTEAVPLQDATMRYESLSRFTATIRDEDGNPVVFVLRRNGLRWRLADIRLPLGDAPPAQP